MLMQLPGYVAGILTTLESHGHAAFLVGGCVRDLLLGRPPSDYDVVTSASTDAIRAIFPHTVPIGARYGTVAVITGHQTVEVTTGKDRFHSSLPGLTGIEADLFWRDFTINAMAMDAAGRLIDPFGGRRDLEGRVIASPGNQAAQRMRDDPLRMVRAIRLSCSLHFTLHPAVFDAIIAGAPLLPRVAAERLRGELDQILLSAHPARGMRLLADTGLLAYIIPELVPMIDFDQKSPHHDKDLFEHTLAVLEASPPRLTVRLAALLHDVGKPACFTQDQEGRGHFYEHHSEGSRMAAAILQRLKYDLPTVETVARLVAEHMSRFAQMHQESLKRLIKRVGEDNLEDLFDLQQADIRGSAPPFDGSALAAMKDGISQIIATRPPMYIKDLAIDGDDLIALGIQQGPGIGQILHQLLELVLQEPDMNQAEILLAKAAEFLSAGAQPGQE
ncbi:MAG: HD domain-containing protein [Syntrophomonas sp.]|nr:HD domain-containing protein [Syntrophomonas sp.]